MPTIIISDLTKAAQKYQPEFRALPYAMMMPTLNELMIAFSNVSNEDVRVVFERKRGIIQPYASGVSISGAELGRAKERKLKVEPAFAVLIDNIRNYKEKVVLNEGFKIDNQTKKHPLEKEVIINNIRTFQEDIIDVIFHAERNNSDHTPMGVVDGFNTLIDDEISGGQIGTGIGNQVICGDLNAPTDGDDFEAFTNLIAWLRQAHPMHRKGQSVLYIPEAKFLNVKDAMDNKLKYKASMEEVQAQLRAQALFPQLIIKPHYALGNGDRLILAAPGNLEFGMNTETDAEFVQVRNTYEDPNLVQFWMQADFGCRINSINPKAFMINEGTGNANELSGDYTS